MKTFKECYQELCDRTGKFDGVAYEGLPVEWKPLLDYKIRKALEDWTWPDRIIMKKVDLLLDENNAAYAELPEGELLSVYEYDPTQGGYPVSFGEMHVWNGKLYLPTTEESAWMEINPPAKTYIGNEEAEVPGYVYDAAIEGALGLLYEREGKMNEAAAQRRLCEELLEDNYLRLVPLRQDRIKVHTR